MQKYLLVFVILLLTVSCASKRFAKKAEEFEKAGLYQDAAEYYYKSVSKNDKNVEAKLGLRRNGQKVLEEKLSDFNTAHKNSNHKEAVHAFLEAEQYHNKMNGVGVDLPIAQKYTSYYEESERIYLQQRYGEGVTELDRDNYDKARQIFAEIRSIDPSYKDVDEKFTVARYQPLYEKGTDQLDNGLFRSAYYTFDQVVEGAGNYRQALSLREDALEKATMHILVPGFYSLNYRNRNDEAAFTHKLKGALNKIDNPFIRLMDASSLAADIFQRGSREIDHEAASLAGVDAVLKGKIIRVTSQEGDLDRSTRKGYMKKEVEKKNDEGETVKDYEYYKTEYIECRQQNRASLEVSFQLISTANGEIIVTDQFRLTESDEVHYAIYRGDDDRLVPGYWADRRNDSPRDEVRDKKSDVRALRSLLDAEKEVKTVDALKSALSDQAVDQIVKKIDQYNPENS
jgi:tetratricopeptide (TPR) repeat protein